MLSLKLSYAIILSCLYFEIDDISSSLTYKLPYVEERNKKRFFFYYVCTLFEFLVIKKSNDHFLAQCVNGFLVSTSLVVLGTFLLQI